MAIGVAVTRAFSRWYYQTVIVSILHSLKHIHNLLLADRSESEIVVTKNYQNGSICKTEVKSFVLKSNTFPQLHLDSSRSNIRNCNSSGTNRFVQSACCVIDPRLPDLFVHPCLETVDVRARPGCYSRKSLPSTDRLLPSPFYDKRPYNASEIVKRRAMAQAGDVTAQPEVIDVTEQQPPPQPSSPTGSTSSKEEKNAREKLKKTSIAGLKQHIADGESITPDETSARLDPSDTASETINSNGTRGRPAKKRSFEDLAKDDAAVDAADNSAQPPEPKSGHHKRMRSRDIAAGDHVPAYGKIEADKSETVHEETDMDAQFSPGGPGVLVDAPSQEEMEQDEASHAISQAQKSEITSNSKDEATETISRESQAGSKIPSGSGFANASTSSPFGQTKSPPKEQTPREPEKVTSPSAFASSGLSAFASTEKSPFGAATSSKSPGGFGSGPAGGFGSSKGGFGSSAGFGSTTTSAFGSGGGFGSAKGFGSTFGAPKPFGTTTAFGTGGPGSGGFGTGKPFTSTAEKTEEEEGENEEDEDSASIVREDADQDPRFHEQQGKHSILVSISFTDFYSRYGRRR